MRSFESGHPRKRVFSWDIHQREVVQSREHSQWVFSWDIHQREVVQSRDTHNAVFQVGTSMEQTGTSTKV